MQEEIGKGMPCDVSARTFSVQQHQQCVCLSPPAFPYCLVPLDSFTFTIRRMHFILVKLGQSNHECLFGELCQAAFLLSSFRVERMISSDHSSSSLQNQRLV